LLSNVAEKNIPKPKSHLCAKKALRAAKRSQLQFRGKYGWRGLGKVVCQQKPNALGQLSVLLHVFFHNRA
jgi:hypothetical protein